jgi:purine-cytosine permease-like protein
MHYFSLALLPISIVLFIAIVAIAGPSLASIPVGEVALGLHTTAGGVLGFGSTCIGFVATWAAFSSDYTSYMPPTASSQAIFWNVYFGLMCPTVLFQIMGAAFQCAAGAVPVWEEGQAANGVAGLLGAGIGTSAGARFLLVMVALNVTGNIGPSIYSVGLSLQVCIPWLLRGRFPRSLSGLPL